MVRMAPRGLYKASRGQRLAFSIASRLARSTACTCALSSAATLAASASLLAASSAALRAAASASLLTSSSASALAAASAARLAFTSRSCRAFSTASCRAGPREISARSGRDQGEISARSARDQREIRGRSAPPHARHHRGREGWQQGRATRGREARPKAIGGCGRLREGARSGRSREEREHGEIAGGCEIRGRSWRVGCERAERDLVLASQLLTQRRSQHPAQHAAPTRDQWESSSALGRPEAGCGGDGEPPRC